MQEVASLADARLASPDAVTDERVVARMRAALDRADAHVRGDDVSREQNEHQGGDGGHCAGTAIDADDGRDREAHDERDNAAVRAGGDQGCDQGPARKEPEAAAARPTRCPDDHDRDEVIVRRHVRVDERQRGAAPLS